MIPISNIKLRKRPRYWNIVVLSLSLLASTREIKGQTIAYSYPVSEMKITSPYGIRMHPILRVYRFHYGIDLASNRDSVKSILSGRVLRQGYSKTLGYFVTTHHGDLTITYGHLSAISVQRKSLIKAGEMIGITGSTGRATADHLHLEVKLSGRTIDPQLLFKQLKILNH